MDVKEYPDAELRSRPPTNTWRRRRDRLAALQSSISAQERDERQRAVRALLSQPLLSPEGSTSESFKLVQKHRDWLRPWFAHHAAWQLMLDSEAARLIKRPARLDDATRPCREPISDVPLSRRAYVILCLALASLVRADRQTTLVRLRDSIIGLVRAEPRFETAGIRVELEHQESRRDFVHAIRLLLVWRVLERKQGEEERFIKDAQADALYNVHRPVLARLLAANRPPSLVSTNVFRERLRALAEDDITATSDEARHRRLRLRLFHQLLDDPVLYYDELSEEDREYWDRQRGFILPEIEMATGLVREVRAEGVAMTDPSGTLSDYGLPEEGTDGHITLLLATFLAGRLRESPGVSVGFDTLVARTSNFIAVHYKHWRKDVREQGQDRALTRMVVERLCALRLMRQEGDLLFPLPAIGRYGLREEYVTEPIEDTLML
ncbi:MAG: TIGR02678 family protein [Chthoniobacter sp.]|uniref:TIGR02678 family protein n=1 Tax=Chthoniobacter sp. TaxID=2510640 RepID=UPI0032A28FA0